MARLVMLYVMNLPFMQLLVLYFFVPMRNYTHEKPHCVYFVLSL